MPILDKEIYGCANFMVDKHGEDATFMAAQRADELHEMGDLDGQRTWLSIIKAIGILQDHGHGELRH